jgi:hypothetical protein
MCDRGQWLPATCTHDLTFRGEEDDTMATKREQLLARRAELQQRMLAIRADLGRGLAADSEEQAVQLGNMAVLQEIHRLAEQELKQIEMELAGLEE